MAKELKERDVVLYNDRQILQVRWVSSHEIVLEDLFGKAVKVPKDKRKKLSDPLNSAEELFLHLKESLNKLSGDSVFAKRILRDALKKIFK